MIYLTIEEVLYLHFRLIKRTGGVHGIRDLGLLQSALARPLATFNEVEAYPTFFDKGAALSHSIIQNHPFIDGNKRTGIAAAGILLKINGYSLKVNQEEMVRFTLAIAKGEVSWYKIADWLKQNCK